MFKMYSKLNVLLQLFFVMQLIMYLIITASLFQEIKVCETIMLKMVTLLEISN